MVRCGYGRGLASMEIVPHYSKGGHIRAGVVGWLWDPDYQSERPFAPLRSLRNCGIRY